MMTKLRNQILDQNSAYSGNDIVVVTLSEKTRYPKKENESSMKEDMTVI